MNCLRSTTLRQLLLISAVLLSASLPSSAQKLKGIEQEPEQLPSTQAALQRALIAGKLKFGLSRHVGPASPHSEPQPLPHWTGSFKATTGANRTAETQTYSYTMVGTDPSKGSATTSIRTILVPLRLQFEKLYDNNGIEIPGGAVLDASTDIAPPLNTSVVNNILRSPQFTPSPVYSGAVNLGNTQYADAMQRGNLWNIVSSKAPDYHVLLKPEIYATQTIFVPAGSGYVITSFDGSLYGVFFEDQISSSGNVIADIVSNVTAQVQDPAALVIVVSRNSISCNAFDCAGGYHGVLPFVAGAMETSYIYAGYFDGDNIRAISHEVSEWINDPFLDNSVPAWGFVGDPGPACSNTNLLEVGDPIEFLDSSILNYPVGGITWHPQDIVFLPWFEGAVPSTSVNGWYTFANSTSAPEPCQGSYDYRSTILDFPGADWTHAFGVNNQKTIVGDYHVGADSRGHGGTYHGFIYQNGVFTSLDVPGASLTDARGVNDAGQVAGVFNDSNGNEHGFSYSQGAFQVIDFPDPTAAFTEALGINNSGVIVGDYVDANFVGHSFQWSGGKFTVFNPPFSVESAACGISNSGTMVGGYDTDYSGSNYAYNGSPGSFAPFILPRAQPGTESATLPFGVNSRGDVAGWFCDVGDCSMSQFNGFVWSGIKHTWAHVEAPNARWTELFGINDNGVVVGYYRVKGPRKGNEHAVVLTPK